MALLTMSDINTIVDQMKAPLSHLSIEKRKRLLELVNYQIAEYDRSKKPKNKLTPSQITKKWNEIDKLSGKLRSLTIEIKRHVTSAFDRFTQQPEFGDPPSYQAKLKFRTNRAPGRPSINSENSVTDVIKYLSLLKATAATIAAARKNEDRKSRGPKGINLWRYALVKRLSDVFLQIFEVRPSATLDGPWEFFLLQVLSRCEENEDVSPEAIHGLWLKVKRIL